MEMKPKYIAAIVCGVAAIFLWNGLIILRDNRMWDALETRKEMYCKQQAGWHPDCNVE
jgi:hypothetical protein